MKSVLSFTVVFLLSFGAFAAKKQTPPPEPPVDENYVVPVQQQSEHIDAIEVPYTPIIADYEFSTSTWTPSQFTRPSLIPSDSTFQDGSIPMLGITRIAPLRAMWGGIVETDMGLDYAQLIRNGQVTSGASTSGTQETLNVVALKLGVSYRLPSLGTRHLQPSIEADALPTWISSERSAFEQYGVNAFGVMFAADLKLMYCPDFMQRLGGGDRTGEGLGVAYLMTAGNVGGSDLTGAGAQAILRMGF